MTRLFLTGGSGFIGGEIANAALEQGHGFALYDLAKPNFTQHMPFWVQGDVRDLETLSRSVEAFRPDAIIHLASDTDVQITRMEEFTTTLCGTQNVIDVIQRADALCPNLSKFVHISTQFVVKPGITPESEIKFAPYTVYGEAKAETERMVRAADLPISWLIIRPTIIWGPHHPSFRENIFRHISSRHYLHPSRSEKILRAFGYVENTAQQVLALTLSGEGREGRRVFYVGDDTIDYDIWADAFSVGLTGKPARRIPLWLLSLLGGAGDILKKLGLPAPVDSGRVFRMSTSSAIDLSPTHAITGAPKIPFPLGVRKTIEWLRRS
ncbi:NAD-dependent epimerase/dehydratase family protein [Hephaestia sp. GCM10023244]|uniref:NAD-dependent epimerase/dehydratase family protein n=1 Tax=unclassified Hephaestia TaxID=2631281 RepID=UPI0020773899|nr:NAD(P)-dependent oxidoreductase [Hephaestia sp. MAHUQ-44]MCM8732538.1 NAD(P)-dependent oxidoreductase [Hephaestia sp. MAHUQ-44]